MAIFKVGEYIKHISDAGRRRKILRIKSNDRYEVLILGKNVDTKTFPISWLENHYVLDLEAMSLEQFNLELKELLKNG